MDASTCQTELTTMANALQSVDCGEPLGVVRAMALMDIEQGFASKTSPDGQPWAPRKDNKPHPLEILSGTMHAAATGKSGGAADYVEFNACQVGLKAGAVFYDMFQQFGTSKMVARPFVGIRNQSIDAGAEKIADHVLAKVFS